MIGLIRPLPELALCDELRRQQYEALKVKGPIMYAVVFIQLAAWMIGADESLSPILSYYGPAVLMAAISFRTAVWLLRRRDNPDAARIRRRIYGTIIVAWAIGLCLGGLGISILLQLAPGQFSFPLLLICLAAMAGAYCLSVVPAAAFPTIVAGAMPVGILLMLSAERLLIAAGADLVLTCIIVLRMVMTQYREFLANIVGHAHDRRLAHSDALTGLPNRRAFMEHLQGKIAKADWDAPFALLMIDLNGFKPINDNYGHGLGDQVLVDIARRFRRLGAGGFAARLGGDEFAIIAPGVTNADIARDYAGRIMQIFDRPFCVDGVTVTLSASIGVALFPDDAQDEISLLSNADLALYRGKRGGGSHIVLYDRDIKAQTRRAMQVEQIMGLADSVTDIEVAYQPVVRVSTGEILAFEALARWTDPELGNVNPLEFIGAAERTGKISRISERIFDAALLAASSWPVNIGLSINLSAAQLHNPSIPLMLARLLDFYRFNPARLEIELAETAFLKDLDVARQTVGLFRDLGVRIVLDNFGAGFASVANLREIAFDHVKIDGKLLEDIDASQPSQLLVAGVLQLCGVMGIECTAEMVERESQRDILRRLGCQRGQGYLFGRPMPAGDVTAMLGSPDAHRQYSALLAFGEAKKAG